MKRRRQIAWLLVAVVIAAIGVTCARMYRPVPWAGPQRPVRFVSYNIYKCYNGRDAVLAETRRLQPDVLFLQELLVSDAEKLPRDLGMHAGFQAHRNYPEEGVAVLSRHPIRNVRPLFDEDGRAFAVLADVEIDGVRFLAASVHLTAVTKASELASSPAKRSRQIEALRQAWRDAGHPPFVAGGDFNQHAGGGNYKALTSDFIDVHDRLGKDEWTCDTLARMRLDYLVVTPHWTPLDAGTGAAGPSDHRAVWTTVRGN